MQKPERYKVYRNLNNGKFSIMNSQGLVVGHADRVCLTEVKPIIRKAGQRKVRETGVKNVHAFLEGYIFGTDGFKPFRNRGIVGKGGFFSWDYRKKLVYSPFVFDGFVQKVLDKDEYIPYTGSNSAEISKAGIFVD